MTIRPSEMSCSVAYELASTVGSRVAGFVTKWPSLIFDVSRAATASIGIDSCQSTCESYVQAYPKPCFSASWINSSQRWYGGSGSTVTPKPSIGTSLTLRRQSRERLRGQDVERSDRQLELLLLRVLELRVRQPAQRLHEQHHRRHTRTDETMPGRQTTPPEVHTAPPPTSAAIGLI